MIITNNIEVGVIINNVVIHKVHAKSLNSAPPSWCFDSLDVQNSYHYLFQIRIQPKAILLLSGCTAHKEAN